VWESGLIIVGIGVLDIVVICNVIIQVIVCINIDRDLIGIESRRGRIGGCEQMREEE